MKIVEIHSHLGGLEWLAVRQKNMLQEIKQVIRGINVEKQKLKINEANTKAANDINGRFEKVFSGFGWSEIKTNDGQIDFVKNRVAVEIQFGKYSFIAYDLFVKHLAFYMGDTIDVGIEILPMKAMQEHMSSGPGYFEGALYDIARQGRGVPAVPLVIIGIVP